jgi:signal transduction histidine kinase
MDLSAEVDAGLLAKALTSIVADAVDTCEAKGGIEITFALSRHFSDLVRLDREVRSLLPGHSGKEEEFLRIVIRNDGPGIRGGIRDRIFVPFDSTKKSKGGIGLPVAQKIISAHGGILEFEETAKKGAEFSVKIPIKQKR